MQLTVDQNKALINKFPFLQPRNLWTDKIPEDYDFTWIRGTDEVPAGWERLFLLMCKNVLPLLENSDDLRFSQIKEKYGTLHAYHSYKESCKDAHMLINGYEMLSKYICQNCGNPSTKVTSGWIGYFCKKCVRLSGCNAQRFKRKLVYKQITYSGDKKTVNKINMKKYYKEILKCNKFSDEIFINYILN